MTTTTTKAPGGVPSTFVWSFLAVNREDLEVRVIAAASRVLRGTLLATLRVVKG